MAAVMAIAVGRWGTATAVGLSVKPQGVFRAAIRSRGDRAEGLGIWGGCGIS